jgi:hypothetical protein
VSGGGSCVLWSHRPNSSRECPADANTEQLKTDVGACRADESGAVGIRLKPAAAIVSQDGEQLRRKLAPGIVTMGILFTAVFSGIEIIWDREFGFLKETLVAPVPRLEIVLGRTLGSATVALIQGSIVFLVCLAAGFPPAHPLLLPLALLFMALSARSRARRRHRRRLGIVEHAGLSADHELHHAAALPFFECAVPGAGSARSGAARRAAQPMSYGVAGLRGAAQWRFRVRRRDRCLGPRRPRRNPACARCPAVLENRGIATRCSTRKPRSSLPCGRRAAAASKGDRRHVGRAALRCG